MIAFNLPPIIGLGTGSGFEYQLQDLRGGDPAELAAAARGLVFTANQDPALRAVFTTYSANTPQLYLDVDRDKVQTLGISVGDVFNALQAILGGFYINDFNLFGRTWQVNVQAEAADRAKVDDIYRIHVRNRQGQMVPLRAFAEPRLTLRPQTIVRYNNYRSVTLNGGPAPRAGARARRSPPWSTSPTPRCPRASATSGPVLPCRRRRRLGRPR